MKNDRYLKFILTVIAICLIWICLREMPITPKLHADSLIEPQMVNAFVMGINGAAFVMAEPIKVKVTNIQEISEQILAIIQKDEASGVGGSRPPGRSK